MVEALQQSTNIIDKTPTIDYRAELADTKKSLEFLKDGIELTPAEKEAIKTLPDYNPNAFPEEQRVREIYFTKLKSELISEIEQQKERFNDNISPLSQALQGIPIIQKRENGLSERKVEGKNDFEKLIIYLGNKSITKGNAVACSAIDIGIWLKDASSSSYLMDKRYDYSHMDEVIKYKEIKDDEKKSAIGNLEEGIKNKPIKRNKIMPLGDGKGLNTNMKPYTFEMNGFDSHTMKSYPFQRGPDKIKDGRKVPGTTLCSLTTRLNLENLGLSNPPRGDAIDAMLKPDYFDYGPLVGSVFTNQFKPEWKEIRDKNKKKKIEEINECANKDIITSVESMAITSHANCGEIYLSSKSSPQYGHRAAIFKGTDDERYVLDPYVGGAGTKPQLLKDYLNKCESKGRKVYRINLFQSQT